MDLHLSMQEVEHFKHYFEVFNHFDSNTLKKKGIVLKCDKLIFFFTEIMDNDTIQQSRYTYHNPEVNQVGWTYPHFGYEKVVNKKHKCEFCDYRSRFKWVVKRHAQKKHYSSEKLKNEAYHQIFITNGNKNEESEHGIACRDNDSNKLQKVGTSTIYLS